MSGKNPFWNYDYNAAQRNREIVDSYQQANEARLDSQQAQFEASMANDKARNLQMRLNQTIASHKRVMDGYEQQLEGFKHNFYKIALQRNIFKTTLDRLQEQWPERKEDILDEIQRQRDRCNMPEYREKWWNAVSQNNIGDSVLEFPYAKRELKNKP
ncbi:hypothetical protein ACI5OG_001532 [Salmonella enterica subsp. enterica serovar Derby]|uniref:Uncharacterized protein n=4 Tax=Salmonella enterica TaxID=28901 RepID=A0A5U4QD45_SALER|nr:MULTISPECIES: hypothetical protein [Salmonella]EAY2808473.1 hypothetical protein [Salmonella enterica subsp. enterica serovar Typhimurium]EBE3863092.1 hypothetical protein [Salmonella enterica subsp. enterica serovar Agona]EBP4033597.1 hypothetical protein [Salmonella enterica subsp. salamae]EBW8717360.1 hypothetical protein [Salmonella enterica subsp. enterica serovar Oranienburg]EDS5963255.1 hypothetical protein [Salmonella enterica subsp. enterica serovar Berta]EDU6160613.1 hypothetical